MLRRGLYAGTASTALGLCGIWAYCAAEDDKPKGTQRRIIYDMTGDHIASLQNHPELQLKFVQVIFQHGARTPLSEIKWLDPVEWKNDEIFSGADHTKIKYNVKSVTGGETPEAKVEKIYRSKKPLPGGAVVGQLTALGMDHCYKLGQRLKQHYQHNLKFLPKSYNQKDFYFRSTNILRTIESLRCAVAGMCSPVKGPIDIFVAKSEQEVLYPNSFHCPVLRRFHTAIYENSDHVPGMRPHRLEVQGLLGMSPDEHVDFVTIRDVVMARAAHGLYVPEFLTSQLDHIDKQACNIMTYTLAGKNGRSIENDVLQMNAGNLINFVTTNLETAADNPKNASKMHLYSCHDTSLIPALLTLDAFPDRWPDWAADLIFELYQDKKGQSYVRALYLGEEICIRGEKEALITLEKFKELVQPFSLKFNKFEHLCQLPKETKS